MTILKIQDFRDTELQVWLIRRIRIQDSSDKNDQVNKVSGIGTQI